MTHRLAAADSSLLPGDNSTEIIYYRGGYDCPLSSKSAAKAVAQGYTNVKLFQAGYPAWKQAYGASEAPAPAAVSASAAPKIETGEEAGIITIASFNKLMKENPDDFYWYDIRDPEEVEADGTYGGAVVMAVDEVEDQMDQLPTDKPIVFFCSTGARSGEAYDLVRMKREDLEVCFLDANVEFHKDGRAKKGSDLAKPALTPFSSALSFRRKPESSVLSDILDSGFGRNDGDPAFVGQQSV